MLTPSALIAGALESTCFSNWMTCVRFGFALKGAKSLSLRSAGDVIPGSCTSIDNWSLGKWETRANKWFTEGPLCNHDHGPQRCHRSDRMGITMVSRRAMHTDMCCFRPPSHHSVDPFHQGSCTKAMVLAPKLRESLDCTLYAHRRGRNDQDVHGNEMSAFNTVSFHRPRTIHSRSLPYPIVSKAPNAKGPEKTVKIYCLKCDKLLYLYRKAGKGSLVKCFEERIAKDYTRGDLQCPHCNTEFARPAMIRGKPAHKIIGGKVTMRK